MSKISEIIIMSRYQDRLCTSDLQFAFKAKHSTVMCTYVLKEVVRYYSNNGSDVFSCYGDATKAFDRVQYDKLFCLLIDRGMPPIIIRSILDIYIRQNLRTHWRGYVSDNFSTTNGIRQGGVISPVLFCVYIDELLTRLEKKGAGCWVGSKFYGAIGYADDLSLLAPTVSSLKSMLRVCEEFSREYNVQYNSDKTVCMQFTRKQLVCDYDVQLNGQNLSWVKYVKHLGNYLDCDMSEKTEIRMKRSDLVYRVNHTIATLGKCNRETIVEIFNTKCCHFYGAQAWNLSDKSITQFQTMWNRCARRILDIPYTTHCIILPGLVDRLSAIDQIYCRFNNMVQSMLKTDNIKVNFLVRKALQDSNSVVKTNLFVIAKAAECSVDELFVMSVKDVKRSLYKRYVNIEFTVEQLKQLLAVRHGTGMLNGFTYEEVNTMILHLCTN